MALLPLLLFQFVAAPNLHAARTDSPGSDSAADEEIGLHELLDFLDRNGDGRIEAYEGADGFLLLTQEADADRDGALAEPEVRDFLADSMAEERAEQTQIFRELDEDGDGALTAEDLPEEVRPAFAALDGDGDGALGLEEFVEADVLDDPAFLFEQELLGFLREVDQDGDGAFALSDLPALDRPGFTAQFEALDRNHDQHVDRPELLALLEEELRGASFEVDGSDALMTGVIGPSTPGRVLELLLEHPEVDRIIMLDVPGSMDDVSNLRAARYVRRAGLSTHVPEDGEVASGGTDFFQAGVVRTRGAGARFGVHSWSGFGEEGSDVAREDPEHEKYVEYYREMGIPEAFYWYTLEAASADDIHWMTGAELQRYAMLTNQAPEETEEDELLGGCVLMEPLGTIPENLIEVTPVLPTEAYGPFSKTLSSCGITLAAEGAVPDRFLELVGQTISEIFRETETTDAGLQRRVLEKLHAYRALLPVPKDEDSLGRLIDGDQEDFERIVRENSLCDIIIALVPEGQVMEVVEHILHAMSDVGLHYGFPEEWGLSHESKLWEAMLRAIGEGHYVIDSYADLKREGNAAVYDRVLMQEFAYWFITTAWDLQEPYGPGEPEWTVTNREQLQALFPEFFAVYERTVERVMSAPYRKTLEAIGPRRAEERD